ncbi:MAG: ABC transporter permease [Bryobacteraceae bacterium]|nr:ABC transporter permease [Bryobacteraceae bacterium]
MAVYDKPTVEIEGREVTLQFGLRDAGAQAVGCQIIDSDSGNYVGESEWTPAKSDVRLQVRLPEQHGHYRLIVSPVDEERGWLYQRRQPALVVDAEVSAAGAVLREPRVATTRLLRLQGLPRSIGRALWYPGRTVARHWSLIRALVERDIRARYRGSLGDALWTVLHPLLLMAVYFFVFGMVLQARFAADPSPHGFALYFLAGMLPWLAFSEAVGRAPSVLLEHRNFIKKLVFPVEILPVNLVIAGLVTQGFAMLVFVLGLVVLRGAVPATVLLLPVYLLPQVLFTLGLCWFLAALGAYLRDLGQMIGFALTLWFFLTPICYPESSLPPAVAPWLRLNPMYHLVAGYRLLFLEGRMPEWSAVAKLWAVAAMVVILGHAWFYKLRRSFADVI